jgi:hypothetical protein
MIEVNLYAITPNDPNSRVGRCVARNRFDQEAMGISVIDFAKSFLKENLDKFEGGIGNNDLEDLINSDAVLSRKDMSCVNYFLGLLGYKLQIQNVADDEEDATGVPSGEVVEWNVIDNNFLQNDYPTATKILPAAGTEITAILKQIVDQSGLFDLGKFAGLKNPFTDLMTNLERIKNVSGANNGTIISRIYELLDQLGIEIFCATSED